MLSLVALEKSAEKSAFFVTMSYANKTDEARKAMLEAEAKLRDHLSQFAFDIEEGKRLSAEAQLARQRFVDQLESLCPAFH